MVISRLAMSTISQAAEGLPREQSSACAGYFAETLGAALAARAFFTMSRTSAASVGA
jgi:hypothetical protein